MFFFYVGFWCFLYLEYLMYIFVVNVVFDKLVYMKYWYKLGDNRYDVSNVVDG